MDKNKINNFDIYLLNLETTEKSYYDAKICYRKAKYITETENNCSYYQYLLNLKLEDDFIYLKNNYQTLSCQYVKLLNEYSSLNLIQKEILSNFQTFSVDVETLLKNSENFLLKHKYEDNKKTTL